MLEYLATSGLGPSNKLRLDFAPRVNVLTGDNGLGKTFVLDLAWWALTHSWAAEPAWAHPGPGRDAPTVSYAYRGPHRPGVTVQYDWATQTWPEPSKQRSDNSLVVYGELNGGFHVWDPVRNPPGPSSGPRAYSFQAAEVWDGLRAESGDRWLCNGLIRDWVSWQERESEEFQTLSAVLSALSPGDSEQLTAGQPVRVWLDDSRDYPTVRMPYGDVPVTQASAGMRRIMALSYLLAWAWHEHRRAALLANRAPLPRLVLLLDECEAHLHPAWQRRLLPSLLRAHQCLGAGLDTQLLVVTHAPLVLASLEPCFDSTRDRLFNFDLQDQAVLVREVPFAPRGEADNWLTSEVFGLAEPRAADQEVLLGQLRTAAADPALDLTRYQQLTERLRQSSLPDVDPVRRRWLVLGERKGFLS